MSSPLLDKPRASLARAVRSRIAGDRFNSIHARIWHTPGMVVTPHVSSDDRARYNDRTLDILMENLRALGDNRPLPNRVDPAKGY